MGFHQPTGSADSYGLKNQLNPLSKYHPIALVQPLSIFILPG